MGSCPEDCVWTEWQAWSECTQQCGTEQQFTSRERIPESNGGEPCIGPTTKTKMCDLPACPVCEDPLVFRDCLDECELSCVDLRGNSQCENNNTECKYGCGCPEGMVLQDGECVKPSECRCVVDMREIYGPLATPGPNAVSEIEPGMSITLDCMH
ncbi:SCO-spondin-like, partial [Anneissia japonica]|uniref:SCO-spondin-like n=1 Tax=Anneissia japonica TaxID=1529436 RepID=UPI0014255D4F